MNLKVALVEDLAMIREGIKVLIDQISDFEVFYEYTNGEEFVNNLDNISPDIVLMDIDMPVMDGIMATKIAITKFPELKIIALSMYNDKKYYYEMITAGAKGFVLKQSTSEELEQAIRDVVHGKNYFSPELLHNVIMSMQSIEKDIVEEKKILLKLRDRDIELLGLICNGLSNKEISEKLFVSIKTVESNKTSLMKKTGSKNNASLIIWAIKNNIIEL